MLKIGGNRNYGFGKQLSYAGHQVLKSIYNGHYGSVAAHKHRWAQFAAWTKAAGAPHDARQVTTETLAAYGQHLRGLVERGEMSVRYAQNLVSTVNVVMAGFRGDRQVWIAPSRAVGTRINVRSAVPGALVNEIGLSRVLVTLNGQGHERIASVLELCRGFGLRLKEASLLNIREALAQATTYGAIDVRQGTKGGRGRQVERWVRCTPEGMTALRTAHAVAGDRNLVPADMSLKGFMDLVHRIALPALRSERLGTIHGLRATYACARYQQLTGHPAPVVTGRRQATITSDRQARDTISRELGHGRRDVAAAYVGGAR